MAGLPIVVTNSDDYTNWLNADKTVLTIPENVIRIENFGFRELFKTNQSIETVQGGAGLIAVGQGIFGGIDLRGEAVSKNLKYVDFHDAVLLFTATERMFKGCLGLERVVFPTSLTAISACAFEGCTALESVENILSVTSIGDKAFKDCTKLQFCQILESLTHIGAQAFENCSSVEILTQQVVELGSDALNGVGESQITSLKNVKGPLQNGNHEFVIGTEKEPSTVLEPDDFRRFSKQPAVDIYATVECKRYSRGMQQPGYITFRFQHSHPRTPAVSRVTVMACDMHCDTRSIRYGIKARSNEEFKTLNSDLQQQAMEVAENIVRGNPWTGDSGMNYSKAAPAYDQIASAMCSYHAGKLEPFVESALTYVYDAEHPRISIFGDKYHRCEQLVGYVYNEFVTKSGGDDAGYWDAFLDEFNIDDDEFRDWGIDENGKPVEMPALDNILDTDILDRKSDKRAGRCLRAGVKYKFYEAGDTLERVAVDADDGDWKVPVHVFGLGQDTVAQTWVKRAGDKLTLVSDGYAKGFKITTTRGGGAPPDLSLPRGAAHINMRLGPVYYVAGNEEDVWWPCTPQESALLFETEGTGSTSDADGFRVEYRNSKLCIVYTSDLVCREVLKVSAASKEQKEKRPRVNDLLEIRDDLIRRVKNLNEINTIDDIRNALEKGKARISELEQTLERSRGADSASATPRDLLPFTTRITTLETAIQKHQKGAAQSKKDAETLKTLHADTPELRKEIQETQLLLSNADEARKSQLQADLAALEKAKADLEQEIALESGVDTKNYRLKTSYFETLRREIKAEQTKVADLEAAKQLAEHATALLKKEINLLTAKLAERRGEMKSDAISAQERLQDLTIRALQDRPDGKAAGPLHNSLYEVVDVGSEANSDDDYMDIEAYSRLDAFVRALEELNLGNDTIENAFSPYTDKVSEKIKDQLITLRDKLDTLTREHAQCIFENAGLKKRMSEESADCRAKVAKLKRMEIRYQGLLKNLKRLRDKTLASEESYQRKMAIRDNKRKALKKEIARLKTSLEDARLRLSQSRSTTVHAPKSAELTIALQKLESQLNEKTAALNDAESRQNESAAEELRTAKATIEQLERELIECRAQQNADFLEWDDETAARADSRQDDRENRDDMQAHADIQQVALQRLQQMLDELHAQKDAVDTDLIQYEKERAESRADDRENRDDMQAHADIQQANMARLQDTIDVLQKHADDAEANILFHEQDAIDRAQSRAEDRQAREDLQAHADAQKGTIEGLQRKVDDLQAQKRTAQDELERLYAGADVLLDGIQELEEKQKRWINDAGEYIVGEDDDFNMRVRELEQEKSELEQNIRAKEKTIASLKDEIDTLNGALNFEDRQNTERIQNLEAELKETTTLLAGERDALSILIENLDVVQTARGRALSDTPGDNVSNSQTAAENQLTEKIQELQAEVIEKSAELQRVSLRNNAIQDDLDTSTAKLEETQKQLADTQKRVKNLNKRNIGLKNAVDNVKDAAKRERDRLIDQHNKGINKLNQRIHASQERVTTLQGENADLNEELLATRLRIDELTEKIKRNVNKADQQRISSRSKDQALLDKYRKYTDQTAFYLLTVLYSERDNMAKLETTLNDQKMRIRDLEIVNDRLKKQADTYDQTIRNLTTEQDLKVADLTNTLQTLQAECDNGGAEAITQLKETHADELQEVQEQLTEVETVFGIKIAEEKAQNVALSGTVADQRNEMTIMVEHINHQEAIISGLEFQLRTKQAAMNDNADTMSENYSKIAELEAALKDSTRAREQVNTLQNIVTAQKERADDKDGLNAALVRKCETLESTLQDTARNLAAEMEKNAKLDREFAAYMQDAEDFSSRDKELIQTLMSQISTLTTRPDEDGRAAGAVANTPGPANASPTVFEERLQFIEDCREEMKSLNNNAKVDTTKYQAWLEHHRLDDENGTIPYYTEYLAAAKLYFRRSNGDYNKSGVIADLNKATGFLFKGPNDEEFVCIDRGDETILYAVRKTANGASFVWMNPNDATDKFIVAGIVSAGHVTNPRARKRIREAYN